MAQNIYAVFGNDLTRMYRVENSGYQLPADTYYIERYLLGNADDYKIYFMHPFLSFGDYDRSCNVERSNVRTFLKDYKDNPYVRYHHGPYSSESIWIDIKCDTPEIIETLQSLDNYPCLDDSDASLMEVEMEDEDWDSYIAADFTVAIERKFSGDAHCTDDKALRTLYESLKNKMNTYYHVEAGGSGYIDIKRLIADLTEVPAFMNFEFNQP